VLEVAAVAFGQLSTEFRSLLALAEQVFERLPKGECRDQAILFLADAFKARNDHSVDICQYKFIVLDVVSQFAFFISDILQTVAQREHERPGDPLSLSQFPCANESSKQRHPQADNCPKPIADPFQLSTRPRFSGGMPSPSSIKKLSFTFCLQN